jgi:2-C-methyl-D-erythritol 4-phosphate cytidylyltransferase/2-C-methyl-D-erythritol 2,4-cyclodiphosphate synthase
MTKIIAIIVAAGKGKRMESKIPKQYLPLNDKGILYHSILPFLNHPKISDVVCVIAKSDLELYQNSILDLNLLDPVFGGQERQDSVFNALEKITDLNPDKILIHDAARPFVTKEIIDSLISLENEAVIPTIKISDTIKKVENGIICKTISRDNLYLAQTPQFFDYDLIKNLHQKYQGQNFTDDSALCEEEKIKIAVIDGDINNFKITTKQDYDKARKIC